MNTKVKHTVKLTPKFLEVNGKRVAEAVAGDSFLTMLYRKFNMDYPKFFKMDVLCKVGFIASEILLNEEGGERFVPRADRAVILFNRNSSLNADRTFQRTIANTEEFYPSPSVFVYTLPNIVCGEIALRNGYHAETSFYIINKKDDTIINSVVQSTFCDQTLQSMVTGWIDYIDDNTFEADFKLIKRT